MTTKKYFLPWFNASTSPLFCAMSPSSSVLLFGDSSGSTKLELRIFMFQCTQHSYSRNGLLTCVTGLFWQNAARGCCVDNWPLQCHGSGHVKAWFFRETRSLGVLCRFLFAVLWKFSAGVSWAVILFVAPCFSVELGNQISVWTIQWVCGSPLGCPSPIVHCFRSAGNLFGNRLLHNESVVTPVGRPKKHLQKLSWKIFWRFSRECSTQLDFDRCLS